MRISEFECDDGNTLHLALRHGIEAEKAEEVFAVTPIFRKTKRGHYTAFGPARSGRLLVVVFEYQGRGRVRVITGWDMRAAERGYYQEHQKE